jgi:Kef-type K+ transport system membrane component KefB
LILATSLGTGIVSDYPRTIAVLGFVILVSFSLGEFFQLIKLPKILGYLIGGAIFSINSFNLDGIEFFFQLDNKVVSNLSFINNIAFAFIALSIGIRLKFSDLRKILGTGFLIMLFKFLFIFSFVTSVFYFLYPLISFDSFSISELLVGGLLLSVVSMGTSIELSMGVNQELHVKNDLVNLTLSSAFIKDLLNLLLLTGIIYLSKVYLLNGIISGNSDNYLVILELLGKSTITGIIFGFVTVLYLRYFKTDITIFLLCIVGFTGFISPNLQIEILLTFVMAGIIIANLSSTGSFAKAFNNFSQIASIIFFTLVGATLNFNLVLDALPIAAVIFVVRIVAIYFSVKASSKFTKPRLEITKYGWAGFISLGMFSLGLLGIISQEMPAEFRIISSIIYDLILLNLIVGPVIYHLALNLNKEPKTSSSEVKNDKKSESIEGKLDNVEKEYKVVFLEPNFFDQKLNKVLFELYFKLIDLMTDFRDNFITRRNNDTEAILEETVAIYRDKFASIESILRSGKDPRIIKTALQKLRINQTEVLLERLEERKKVERDFANSDSIIKNLLNDLIDITLNLDENYPLSVEIDYAVYSKKSLPFKLFIFKLKFTNWIKSLYGGEEQAYIKINLQNYARYFLNSKATIELLETVNLTGADRLNLFRKLKAIHKNFISYLDDLITIIGQEKSSLGFLPVFFMRYEELQEMFFNELDVYISEQSSTVKEIEKRLMYAFASPFNSLLSELTDIIELRKRGNELNFYKAFEESQRVKENLLDSIRFWVIYYHGIIGLIQKELYIYKFEIQLNNFLDSALLNLADEISDRIRNGCPKIADQFRVFTKDMQNLIPMGYETLKAFSDTFRISFSIPELSSLIRDLDKTTRSRKLRTFFDTVINGIKSVSKELPEESVFLEEDELSLKNRTPEFIPLKSFKVRSLTSNFLLLKLPREIGDVNEFLVNYLDSALKEIRNLESSVNYYLDSIMRRIQEDPDDVESLNEILDTLAENFIIHLREIENNNDKLEQLINKQATEKTKIAVSEIKRLITISHKRDGLENRNDNKLTIKSKYLAKIIKVLTKKIFHTIFISFRNLSDKFILPLFNRSVENLKLISGRLSPTYKEDLYKTEEVFNKLPFIYRRLFDGTSLESSELFLGKDEIKRILAEAKERFNAKLPASVLITGAPGSGKTSYIYYIKNAILRPGDYIELYFIERVCTVDGLRKFISDALGYNDLKSIESIIIDLNERFRGKYVLLLNLQKTFVRSVDGFEALKALLHIISMTNSNILWISTVQSVGWQFIKTNFKAAPLFNFTVILEDLNRNKIKDIILHRQHTTGFGYRFSKDALSLLRKRLFNSSKKIGEQSYLEQVYFERLSEYADGNIVSGMNYWLNSISKVEDNNLVIQTYKFYPLIGLSFLDINLITVLHSVILHGGLKKNQLAKSLNISEILAGEYLNKLLSLNLLRIGELSKGHDYYYTNKFKFKSIQFELERRNIL